MYNAAIDVTIFGIALLVLAVVIKLTTAKPKGATPAEDWQIKAHQDERRIRMMDGDCK